MSGYHPGKVFSKALGPRGGKRKDEPHEREYWQEVSQVLQEQYGLAAYQARKKIYKLEEDFVGAEPKVIEIIYHYHPKNIARDIMEFKE